MLGFVFGSGFEDFVLDNAQTVQTQTPFGETEFDLGDFHGTRVAVLHRHAGLACFDQDVFVNAVGGVKITEPAADLAVLLAIYSSMRNRALPEGLVVFGEVGLAGEIRPAPRGQERLKEAAKLGFSKAVIPRANAPKQPIEGLEVIAVDRLSNAIDAVC